MTKRDLVHVVPIEGAAIPPQELTPPIRAVEQDVTPEQWDRIKAFQPPAFRRVAPKPAAVKRVAPKPAAKAPASPVPVEVLSDGDR